jgi:hypothetical protein
MPSVGLEILYESSDNLTKIKVPSEEEKNAIKNKTAAGNQTEKEESNRGIEAEDISGLNTIDEHINYFKDIGYRLINDSESDGARNATLRRYAMDEHSEVIIQSSDLNVSVTQTINGKKVR